MRNTLILLISSLVAACGISLGYEPTTIKERLPIGSRLSLLRALVIPVEHSYVYIVEGEVAPFKDYNSVYIYKPYCMLRLQEPSSQARQVEADHFTVTKIIEWEDYHGGLNTLKLASAELAGVRVHGVIGGGIIGLDDAGPSTIMYATVMSLHSARQPEVKELVCGHWDTQGVVEPLTLHDMQSALGSLIQIE